MIQAFHEAFSKDLLIKLIVAGGGDEYENLERMIKDLDEADRISLYGRYTREESRELFSQVDAFVLTSQVETFGIVYIEALASGLPCIGTKGQGADDIINDDNGYLVEYGNIETLSNCMKKLYENYSHYNQKTIRSDCMMRFDKNAVSETITQVYKKLLKEDKK